MKSQQTTTRKSILGLTLGIAATASSPYIFAEFQVDLGHSSEFSDNADLTETDTKDEREDRTWVELGVVEARKNWQLDTGYRVTAVRFDSDSLRPQENDEQITGRTEFNYLAFKQRAQLTINHDRRYLLTRPEDLDLQINRQARDIFTVSPTYYIQNNSRQNIYISGEYNQINYDSLDDNINPAIDNESIGWAAGIDRKVSAVNTFGFRIEQFTTEYDSNFIEDTDYSRILGYYAAELRRLSYRATLGYNRSETAGRDSLDSPLAGFSLAYDTGSTQIGFYTQYFITDTARGNMAGSSFNQDPDAGELGNGNTTFVSRYELLTSRFELTQLLGRRFTATLGVEIADQNHLENDGLDQTSWLVDARLTHQLTENITWTAYAAERELEFDQGNDTGNTFDNYGLQLNYRPSERLLLGLNGSVAERSSESSTRDYKENRVQLILQYALRP